MPIWGCTLKLYDEETEIAGAENFGQVDMDCFDQMKDLTNQLVSVLEEEIPVSGTLLRTMLEDNVPQDDGSAWYVYVAKSKIIDCLEAVMRFQMVLNHILSLLAQGGQVHPSDFPFLKEMSVTQIVRYDSTITTQYHFRAEADYLKFLLMQMQQTLQKVHGEQNRRFTTASETHTFLQSALLVFQATQTSGREIS